MAQHYNPSLAEDANRIFNTKQGNQLSTLLADFIQPTKEIGPTANIVANNAVTATGSFPIFTTPTDKDFYLTGITYSFSKNATCDLASGNLEITVTILGAARSLLAHAVLTLTAERDIINLDFTTPIKIDRGTAITAGAGTFTVGAMARYASVRGYTVEVTK